MVDKWDFQQSKISFLRLVGATMDQAKVTAVTEWPESCSERLSTFANFYHTFLWGFNSVAASLFDLLKSKSKK